MSVGRAWGCEHESARRVSLATGRGQGKARRTLLVELPLERLGLAFEAVAAKVHLRLCREGWGGGGQSWWAVG